MFPSLFMAALVATSVTAVSDPSSFNCDPPRSAPSSVCYVPDCTRRIAHHIQEELNAAFSYLYMAAHFDDDRIARHGLAKFLYESASEERQHAILMLEYLNKRGVLFNETYNLKTSDNEVFLPASCNEYRSLTIPIKTIKFLSQHQVTNSIYKIVEACGLDFHAADVFTDPILDEQHEGIRKLQGAIRTFKDMTDGHTHTSAGAMAEFMFDQKILANGL
ncbi:ferritin subunit [Hyalella azteca]|uniref:Ferritin n=1 Tax=Hyalella azteca TaxID=294128 RepID=A0A979FHP3_HYAAZ|nr:ferritin subunit [Hyalella azteca]